MWSSPCRRDGEVEKSAPEGGYIPNPYGRDLGLGYRVRTLPQGFLSPTRGTERVVKTIADRWGKYSTVGRFPSFCISPIQRPHYITNSYTYQFFEKNYICSPPQYRSALVATRMRKNALINMVHNY